jgi:hypothetical protein
MNRKLSAYIPTLFVTAGLFGAATASSTKNVDTAKDCAPLCYATPLFECESPWEIEGSALYQQFRCQGQEIAVMTGDTTLIVPPNLPTTMAPTAGFQYPTHPSGAVGVEPNEDFAWGFRIGLGYRTWYDDWKISVKYSYLKVITNVVGAPISYTMGFNPSAYSNQAINGGLFLTVNPNPSAQISQRSLFRNLDYGISTIYNDLNFVLSRPTKITQDLELTTFIGFDVSFFTRRMNPVFTNDNANFYQQQFGQIFQNYQKIQWWGVGPMIGLHTSWYLAYDWSFYGDAYTSLEYGLSSSRTATLSRSKFVETTREAAVQSLLYQYSPNYQFGLGLSWFQILDEFDTKLTFKIGYETTYYSQVIKTIVPEINYRAQQGSGLGTQGLVLTGTVDF